MIELAELAVQFGGRTALGPVSGRFGPGAVLVAGPAQSGKTTLLKAMCGLLPASSGKVRVDGVDLAEAGAQELEQVRARFGMVFQSDALFDSLDALSNVALPLSRRGVPADEARRRAREVLARVGLEEHERALPERLSGGMRKRLGLARALVSEPHYLLADDPLAGLDPGTTARVLQLILDLGSTSGGLVLATADPAALWERFDEALVLDAGRVVARGPAAAVRADPRVAALFGELSR